MLRINKITRNFGKLKEENDCWIWTGALGSGGYGKIYDGKLYQAHRWFYEQIVGPIPHGKCLCHRCDIPKCVNPNHILVGDNHLNWQDAREKGRVPRKLKEENIREIRHLHGLGWGQKRIAFKFGVCRTTVKEILKFESWSWVK